MLKKIIKTYYKLLDEKLENWTIIVIVIAALVVWASIFIKDTNAVSLMKSNVLESNSLKNINQNTVDINWVKYKIHLEEFEK